VKTAVGDTVAFLSPDADKLKDCYIEGELNSTCKLEFQLPIDSAKWVYLTDQYRIYAGGREFTIANSDAIDASREGEKLWGQVRAQESWILLGKAYAETGISNDPSTPSPAPLAVIIVSGGSDLSGGRYTVGSAGHALYALLGGTDWTVGTVDVTGTFDLETEKESILANINKVQEKWGGNLVWDSINKTVSLRDETLWQNYTGFGVRYAKNLKTVNRIDDYEIITRLYPFGADDLNIGTVNDGIIYLDNTSYSSKVLTGVWTNQDLATAQQVKDGGTAYLAKMCKPRHTYKIEMLDLRTVSGYEHETFDIGHLIDIADEEIGINDRARIIRCKYNIFQPWLCELDAGDPIEKIAASIANTIKATRFVNANKSNAGFQNLLKAKIDTAATEINGASGDYTCIDGVSTWLNPDDGSLTRITPRGLVISPDGGLTWQTAVDGNGFYGNAAWVEKIAAAAIQIGVASTYEEGYDPSEALSAATTAQSTANSKLTQPGYVQATENGLNVFDAEGVSRAFWGQYASSEFGGKVMHADGSYTLLNAEGLRRHLTGGNKDYMYLVATGTGGTEYSGAALQECYLGLMRYLRFYGSTVTIPFDGVVYNMSTDTQGLVTGYSYYTSDMILYNYVPTLGWTWVDGFGGLFAHGDATNDSGVASITEANVLAYVPEIWVQLPDDFKGKTFNISLSISSFYIPDEMDGGDYRIPLVGNPKFVLQVTQYDYANARFKVKAYYQVYHKYSRPQQVQDGSSTLTRYETTQIFYARGINFSYVALV